MKKILNKPYEKDEFFKKWLVGLSHRTKKELQQRIPRVVLFIDMTPTEQIKKRMHDLTTRDIPQRGTPILRASPSSHQKRQH